MVVVRSRSCCFIFIACTIFVVFSFVLIKETTNESNGQFPEEEEETRKEIVAYSLLKQIELENKVQRCENITGRNEGWHDTKALWVEIDQTDFFVYSVYNDERLYPYKYLRIIGMVKGDWREPLFCQILCADGVYHIVRAIKTEIWSKIWDQNDKNFYYKPILLSCGFLPNQTAISVSLSKIPCKISLKELKINFAPKSFVSTFTICVKPLNFKSDISAHLLQWIVMNRILGAEKIEFYIESVDKKVENFLKNLPNITLHRHKKIEKEQNSDMLKHVWQKRRYELITLNDCFYRNIHSSHFVIPVDIDEIIVPRNVLKWSEIFNDTSSLDFASYTVRNAYYLKQFTRKNEHTVFFFRDTIRSQFSDEGESGKSFVSTQNTLTVFNHCSLEVLKPGIRNRHFLSSEMVQMNHYKNDCSTVILPQCSKYISGHVRVFDNVIFKYKKLFYEEYVTLSKKLLYLS